MVPGSQDWDESSVGDAGARRGGGNLAGGSVGVIRQWHSDISWMLYFWGHVSFSQDDWQLYYVIYLAAGDLFWQRASCVPLQDWQATEKEPGVPYPGAGQGWCTSCSSSESPC